jgi:hypothetical protein
MTELSLHILDLVQNSITAKASLIEIKVLEDDETNHLSIEIIDNGTGMDNERLQKVSDPFFTTRKTRKVGLGLSLFRQAAEQCNGSLTISSQLHKGTTVKVVMDNKHVDKQPMGDIPGVISLMVSANPTLDFTYTHITGKGTYLFTSKEVKQVLEDVPVNDPKVVKFMKAMIQDNLNEINAST